MFEQILLEPEQITLLSSFIEMLRNIPREKRIKFIGSRMSDGRSSVIHPYAPGQNLTILLEDIEILNREGLVNLSYKESGSFNFSITPLGLKYYEYQQTQTVPISMRIEKPLRNYLEGDRLRQVYPLAFDKWSKAESKLWSTDTQDELSIVGHLCREAMQEFVTCLVDKYKPLNVDEDKSRDISRLRCVINHCANHLPKTIVPFLDSIISYWGTLNDLVQRQEHAAQKEGLAVNWEDARRVVFHTAVVFLEIDKVLSNQFQA